jgi:hypothetical protein
MHALAIFLGAFLVFQVQPLLGKYILPWFGGSPGVWTTCLLFFQVMLLAGYGYAHFVVLKISPKAQGILHGGLLLLSLALLPVTPDESWKVANLENPTWWIFALLTVTVGGPYVLLSATAPLIQSWFVRKYVARSPYRLYALSNVGALLALLSYPTLIEPQFAVDWQSWMWSSVYIVFAGVCVACAWQAWRGDVVSTPLGAQDEQRNPESCDLADTSGGKLRYAFIATWLCLAATGTVMLMATTNQMCQDIASVPFLWVLPLALYLLTFIICFDHDRWYHRGVWTTLMIVGVVLATLTLRSANVNLFGWQVDFNFKGHAGWQIAILSFAMFSCVMCCHGELVRLRPPSRDLTLFYLMISTGGALGGVFVAIVAPIIFDRFWEIYLGLFGSCLIVYMAQLLAKAKEGSDETPWTRVRVAFVSCAAIFVLAATTYVFFSRSQHVADGFVHRERNFYGILRVEPSHEPDKKNVRKLFFHGSELHGSQYLDASRRELPTAYYTPRSGVGVAIAAQRRLSQHNGKLRIGAIGLGAGAISAYAQEGDYWRYYEINPAVIRIAREHFSFLGNAKLRGADNEVYLGDARVVLEQQLLSDMPQEFDLLVVDAFAGDSVPMHLLTRECFDLYRRHLAPGGLIAVHISNWTLKLESVVRGAAQEGGDAVVYIYHSPTETEKSRDPSIMPSKWTFLSKDAAVFNIPEFQLVTTPWPKDTKPLLWTDDFSSLLKIVR